MAAACCVGEYLPFVAFNHACTRLIQFLKDKCPEGFHGGPTSTFLSPYMKNNVETIMAVVIAVMAHWIADVLFTGSKCMVTSFSSCSRRARRIRWLVLFRRRRSLVVSFVVPLIVVG